MKTRLLAFISAIFAVASFSHAQSNPPAWSSTATYKIGDLVTYEGVAFQCQINETNSHPTPHTLSWGIYYVYSGVLPIPVGPGQVLTTLTQAWTYIAGARIANNSSIVLELQSGYAETFSNSFSLDHPFGSRISIDATSGATATFTTQTVGFYLDSGNTLEGLTGLTIVGPSGGTNGAAAVQVTQNACLRLAQNLTISNFDLGLYANSSGTIDNVQSISLSQFKLGGFEADNNANINITYPLTVDGTQSSTTPEFGFCVKGGTLNCGSCTSKSCDYNFYALHGGKLEAQGTTATSGTGAKFGSNYFASDHASIYAGECSCSGSQYGFDCTQSSFIDATQSTVLAASKYYSYFANGGATIDATGHNGGTSTQGGATDGSYVFGF